MSMLGNKALTRRPVRAMDGTMLAPAETPLPLDRLAPLPSAPPGLSQAPPPSSLLSVLEPSEPMKLNVPRFTLPATTVSSGYEGPRGWKLAAGILGDALAGAAGQPAQFAPMMERRRQEQTAFERGEQQYQRRRTDEIADRMAEANKTQFFSGNEDRIAYDPTTGTTRTLYDAPTDAQTYAGTLGHQPGSDDYSGAIRDYVLRSNGPTALDGRFGLEAVRTDGRQRLQTQRLGVTQRGQDLSDARGRRGQDLANSRGIRGQDLGDRRGRYSKGFSGGKGSVAGDGAVAVNKATGERMILRGGAWVPYQ